MRALITNDDGVAALLADGFACYTPLQAVCEATAVEVRGLGAAAAGAGPPVHGPARSAGVTRR